MDQLHTITGALPGAIPVVHIWPVAPGRALTSFGSNGGSVKQRPGVKRPTPILRKTVVIGGCVRAAAFSTAR